jgi:hypothetical protein
MDEVGRRSRIGASNLKISDLQNGEPHFSTRPGPFEIVAAEQKSLAVVDLFLMNSSKTMRLPRSRRRRQARGSL